MSHDTSRTVETVFKVTDQTGPMAAIMARAKSLTGVIDHASHMLGHFGVIAGAAAGAFSLHHAIAETQEMLTATRRLQNATGLTAQQAGSILDVFDGMGVSLDETTRAMARMSQRGLQMEHAMAKSTGLSQATSGASFLAQRYKQLGVDIQKGPVVALKQLAGQAQQNKLSAQDLLMLYRMQPDVAGRFLEVLKQGPKVIEEQMATFQKLNIATEENVRRQENIRQQVQRTRAAWEDITGVLVVKLLPVMENVLTQVAEKLESWTPMAQKFGETLGNLLNNHLGTIEKIGKALLINYGLMRMTDKGIGGWAEKGGKFFMKMAVGNKASGLAPSPGMSGAGIRAIAGGYGGLLKQGFGAIKNFDFSGTMRRGLVGAVFKTGDVLGRGSRAVGGALKTGGIAAMDFLGASGPNKLHMMGGGLKGLLTGGGKGITEVIAQMVNGFTRIRPIIMSLGRFTIVGAIFGLIIGLVVRGYQMFVDNINGLRDTVMGWIDLFKARIAVMADLVEPVTHMFSADGVVGRFFTWMVPKVVDGLGIAMDNILRVVQTIILVIKTVAEDWRKALRSPGEIIQTAWRQAQELTLKKQQDMQAQALADVQKAATRREPPPERQAQPYYDFRGSKFDVKQNFAEGFDPDRIAVAFTNDLATLGERRLQSSLAPVFGVR